MHHAGTHAHLLFLCSPVPFTRNPSTWRYPAGFGCVEGAGCAGDGGAGGVGGCCSPSLLVRSLTAGPAPARMAPWIWSAHFLQLSLPFALKWYRSPCAVRMLKMSSFGGGLTVTAMPVFSSSEPFGGCPA